MDQEYYNVPIIRLRTYVVRVLEALGVPSEDAGITADVLIMADRRGVASHGVARLRRYVKGIQDGIIKPETRMKLVKETPTTALISGGDGLGQVAGHKAMLLAMKKAKESGVGMVTVRDSNHYGIAGYYPLMALEEGFIGVSMTNTFPLVVPTFGRNALLGTNPISVSAPAKKNRPFLLDMATSTVPRGKLEVYNRQEKNIPDCWATCEKGNPTVNPGEVLENFQERRGGGLLPLGGGEELTGGHKGYGMAMLVEIFTGVLAGGAYASEVYGEKGKPAKVAHFFAAIDVEAFLPRKEFMKKMDGLIELVKDSEKAEGQERIFIHGEKEFEMMERYEEYVELYYKVVEDINDIGKDFALEPLM